MPYKNPAEAKAYKKLWNEKNREEQRLYNAEYVKQNKEKCDASRADYRLKNREELNEKEKTRKSNIMSHASEMLKIKGIYDTKIWHDFCNIKRRSAKKYPYSEDFTDQMFFDIMKDGCVYCGDSATTIDRLDSSLNHVSTNCVGCCEPCNNSKGNGDPDTFIRKAYYRTYGEYFDDIEDIWSDNKRKSRFDKAKLRSYNQNRPFTLTQDEWDMLTLGECAYCRRRRPENKWNGVDRVIPTKGYTLENTVTCCYDCNIDKWFISIEETKQRNEKIANRMKSGDIVFFGYQQILRSNVKKV